MFGSVVFDFINISIVSDHIAKKDASTIDQYIWCEQEFLFMFDYVSFG